MKEKQIHNCWKCGYKWKGITKSVRKCPWCDIWLIKKKIKSKIIKYNIICPKCLFIWKSRVKRPKQCKNCKINFTHGKWLIDWEKYDNDKRSVEKRKEDEINNVGLSIKHNNQKL